MRVVCVGLGAVGLAAARQLLSFDQVAHLTVVQRPDSVAGTVEALGAGKDIELVAASESAPAGPDLRRAEVVLVAAGGPLSAAVRAGLAAGVPVVVAADDVAELRRLRGLDAEARERGVTVALGATMAPGLSCVLAAHAATRFDRVDEIHVASMGTGGPA